MQIWNQCVEDCIPTLAAALSYKINPSVHQGMNHKGHVDKFPSRDESMEYSTVFEKGEIFKRWPNTHVH